MIDISKPDLVIDLSSLSAPRDILKIMKESEIGPYAYIFKHVDIVMKIGESLNSDFSGERVYRQAGHIFGWEQMLKSGAGMDIVNVINEYQKVNNLTVHKDNVSLLIYDASCLVKHHGNKASKVAENFLIEQYAKLNGKLPVGNFKDTRKSNNANLFCSLFTIE